MFRKSFKGIAILITLIMLMTFGVGCGSDDTGRDTQDAEKTYKIGFVPKSMSNPYFISMNEGIEAEAKLQNVELVVQAPEKETDVARQIQIIEDMITQQVDAILVTPAGAKELVSVIKKANDAGIIVIDIDEKMDADMLAAEGAYYDTYIASDNFLGGKMAAELMIEKLGGEGEVAILEGAPGHEVAIARAGGFNDGISASNIKVVASQTANWARDEGFNVFQNMLTANPNIKGIFAASDLMALGASEAAQQAGRSDIVIIGFDANDEAKEAVKNGTMAGTVAQDPVLMGKTGVQLAIKALNGETISKETPVEIKLVTKETLK